MAMTVMQQHTASAIMAYFAGPVMAPMTPEAASPTESTNSAAPPALDAAVASPLAMISFAILLVVMAERMFLDTACAAKSAEMFCLNVSFSPLRHMVSPMYMF